MLVLSMGGAGAQSVGDTIAGAMRNAEVVDLTVLISEQLAHWPSQAPFQRWTFNWFKPGKGTYGGNLAQSVLPYYGQRYIIAPPAPASSPLRWARPYERQ